jgi:hypothetical protein
MTSAFRVLTAVSLSLAIFLASAHAGGKPSQMKKNHAQTENAQIMSAHDAEKQINNALARLSTFKLSLAHTYPSVSNDIISVIAGFYPEIREAFIQTTHTGAKFKLVFRGIVAHPDLGPGWMDETGYVWFDAPRGKDQKLLNMNPEGTYQYCKDLGAEVPKQERYIKLSDLLGGCHKDYRIPNFLSDFRENYFFLSEPHSDPRYFYYFVGHHGYMNFASKDYYNHPFRCGVSAL